MGPRTTLLSIATCLLTACDPVYRSRVYVDLSERTQGIRFSLAVGVPHPDLAAATSSVATVARQFGFEIEPARENGDTSQWTAHVLTYAANPEQERYRTLRLLSRYDPERERFEVEILEAIASTESEMARRVRTALVDRLTTHFGSAAVHSR